MFLRIATTHLWPGFRKQSFTIHKWWSCYFKDACNSYRKQALVSWTFLDLIGSKVLRGNSEESMLLTEHLPYLLYCMALWCPLLHWSGRLALKYGRERRAGCLVGFSPFSLCVTVKVQHYFLCLSLQMNLPSTAVKSRVGEHPFRKGKQQTGHWFVLPWFVECEHVAHTVDLGFKIDLQNLG